MASIPGTIPFFKIPDVSGGCKCMGDKKKIMGGSKCNYCILQSLVGGETHESNENNTAPIECVQSDTGNTVGEVAFEGGNETSSQSPNADINGGLTSFLNLEGLTPDQKRKFKEAADQLRKSADPDYLIATQGLTDSVQVPRKATRTGKTNWLEKVNKDEQALANSTKSATTRQMAKMAQQKAYQMYMNPNSSPADEEQLKTLTGSALFNVVNEVANVGGVYSGPEPLPGTEGYYNTRSRRVIKKVDGQYYELVDNNPVQAGPVIRVGNQTFVAVDSASVGMGSYGCELLTEQQKRIAINHKNGVKYSRNAFIKSLSPAQKNVLKRSPTFRNQTNQLNREMAALWRMAKESCT